MGPVRRSDPARSQETSNEATPEQPVASNSRRHARGIPHRPPGQLAPLTFAQERIWFLEQMAGASSLFSCPFAIWLRGQLDIPALQRCLHTIEERHDSLRTTFADDGGTIVQVASETTGRPLPVTDLSAEPAAEREQRALQYLNEQARLPFHLATGPVWRYELVRLADDDHLLYVCVHHAVFDVVSTEILFRELAELYRAFCAGAPSPLADLPITLADYAAWERQQPAGRRMERSLAYWQEKLGGPVPVLQLPVDRTPGAVLTHRGAFASTSIPAPVTSALKQMSQGEGLTMFMLLLAAYKVLLRRYSQQDDLLVGIPFSIRSRAEVAGLIGTFINTLVLRTDMSGDPSFREVASRVRDTALDAYSHYDLPFETLVQALHPDRDLSRNPLFRVMFDVMAGGRTELAMPGLEPPRFVEPWELHTGTAKADIHLYAWEQADGMTAAVEYNTDLFDAATIERLLGHYVTLLTSIVADPDRPISQLTMLTDSEREQLIEWSCTRVAHPVDQLVHELVEGQAARQPDAIAVASSGSQLSYSELNCRANQLAHHLRTLGVGPDVLVGVLMSRTPELVTALLAVMKAGGAYVPMDPVNPPERQALMVEDARMPVLLTEQAMLARLPESRATVLCVDRERDAIASESKANPEITATVDHLAYVIFTSGSTGRPKGVQVPHRGLLNLLFWHRARYAVTPHDRATQIAGLAFDASVWELWPYLTAGASVHFPDDEIKLEPERLWQWLADQAITLTFAPTPLAEALLAEQCPPEMALRAMLTGGDKLHQPPPEGLPFELVNHYGPSENSVVATHAPIPPSSSDRPPPIGRPIPNVAVHLLDHHLQRVPIGVAGELHVGGESMARGYHDQPGLVADRFIPDPFEPAGARLYKTGDLARYLPDGNIEFLGRIDNQVKLRGFRIELGEIESVLGQHSAVRHNTVVAHVDATGERRLVAYVVPEPGERAVAAELEHHLRERLPDYMVPAAFCCLESIPVTANGKLDHDRLPEPDHSGQTPTDHALPRTAMERKIAGVWCDVLRREEVGVHDNFFHLGGHSLLMARVCTQLRRLLQRDIALVDLFQHPTVGALAAHLGRRTDQEPEVAVPPSRRQAHGRRESIESVRALKQMARRSHPDSR